MNIDFSSSEESPANYFKDVVFLDSNGNETIITELSFGDDVETIGPYQFYNFTSLKRINFNNVKYIGESAFENCPLDTEFVIPNTVLKIGKAAFKGCGNIINLTIHTVSVCVLNSTISISICIFNIIRKIFRKHTLLMC